MQAVTLALSLAAVLVCTSASPVRVPAHFDASVFTSVYHSTIKEAEPVHAAQPESVSESTGPVYDRNMFSAEFPVDEEPAVSVSIPLRRYASATDTGSGSGTSSGVTPPPPPAPSKKVTQAVTITSLAAADYSGAVKTFYEKSYGKALGIYDTKKKAYDEGCSVDSQIARRSTNIRFSATVVAAKATNAEAKAKEMETDATVLTAAMTTVKNDDTTYAAQTVPAAADVNAGTPTVEVITSGASSIAASTCLAMGLAVLALRH